MAKFNNGKPYHGSDEVQHGRLRGATVTDYVLLSCPRCPNNEVVRYLDYVITHDELGSRYELSPRAVRTFRIVLKLHCQKCGLTDFVKISNDGVQGGPHPEM
jgi:hypothetical protein